jgi:IMP dehydrogenase/GMP reductase
MGYTGHITIKKMQNNCKFVFISKAGARESNVHDVLL